MTHKNEGPPDTNEKLKIPQERSASVRTLEKRRSRRTQGKKETLRAKIGAVLYAR